MEKRKFQRTAIHLRANFLTTAGVKVSLDRLDESNQCQILNFSLESLFIKLSPEALTSHCFQTNDLITVLLELEENQQLCIHKIKGYVTRFDVNGIAIRCRYPEYLPFHELKKMAHQQKVFSKKKAEKNSLNNQDLSSGSKNSATQLIENQQTFINAIIFELEGWLDELLPTIHTRLKDEQVNTHHHLENPIDQQVISDLDTHKAIIRKQCLQRLHNQINAWLVGEPSIIPCLHENTQEKLPKHQELAFNDWVQVRLASNKLTSQAHRELFKLSTELKKTWPSSQVNSPEFYNPLTPEYWCSSFKYAISPFPSSPELQTLLFASFSEITLPHIKRIYLSIVDWLQNGVPKQHSLTCVEKKSESTDSEHTHKEKKGAEDRNQIDDDHSPKIENHHPNNIEFTAMTANDLSRFALQLARPEALFAWDKDRLESGHYTSAKAQISQYLETQMMKELGHFESITSKQAVISASIKEWQAHHPQKTFPPLLELELNTLQAFFSQIMHFTSPTPRSHGWLSKMELTLALYCFENQILFRQDHAFYPFISAFLRLCALESELHETLIKKIERIISELICQPLDEKLFQNLTQHCLSIPDQHQKLISALQQRMIKHFQEHKQLEKNIYQLLTKLVGSQKTTHSVAEFLKQAWYPLLIKTAHKHGKQSVELKKGIKIFNKLVAMMPPSRPVATYTPSQWMNDIKSYLSSKPDFWQQITPLIKKILTEYKRSISTRKAPTVNNALVYLTPYSLENSQLSSSEIDSAWDSIQRFKANQSFIVDDHLVQFIWSDRQLSHFLFLRKPSCQPWIVEKNRLIELIANQRLLERNPPTIDAPVTVLHTLSVNHMYAKPFKTNVNHHGCTPEYFKYLVEEHIHKTVLMSHWHAISVINIDLKPISPAISHQPIDLISEFYQTQLTLEPDPSISLIGFTCVNEGQLILLWSNSHWQTIEAQHEHLLTPLQKNTFTNISVGLAYSDGKTRSYEALLKKARYACVSLTSKNNHPIKVYSAASYINEQKRKYIETQRQNIFQAIQKGNLLLKGHKLEAELSGYSSTIHPQMHSQTTTEASSIMMLVQCYITPDSTRADHQDRQEEHLIVNELLVFGQEAKSLYDTYQHFLMKEYIRLITHQPALPMILSMPYPLLANVTYQQKLKDCIKAHSSDHPPVFLMNAIELDGYSLSMFFETLDNQTLENLSIAIDFRQQANIEIKWLSHPLVKYAFLPQDIFSIDQTYQSENTNKNQGDHAYRILLACQHYDVQVILPIRQQHSCQQWFEAVENIQQQAVPNPFSSQNLALIHQEIPSRMYWQNKSTLSLEPFLVQNNDATQQSKVSLKKESTNSTSSSSSKLIETRRHIVEET